MRPARGLLRGLTAALTAGLVTATLLVAPPMLGSAAAVPSLRVSTVVGGLAQPWDVKPLPDRSLLITERSTKRLLRYAGGRLRAVSYPSSSVWAQGETGLMSLEVDPAFAQNRRFYTCQGGFNRGTKSGRDVRVVAWRLSADGTRATRSKVLFRGIPARTGRHGGCRLLITRGGSLVVGTGDAAVGANPRNLRSAGGKVLRMHRFTGRPASGNPYLKARNKTKRYVYSYGHRNIQGLAERSGRIWSVEHGSSRDDEVNRIKRRGDYGWHPVPGYNESRPMTDQRLRGKQQAAKWRSGRTTIATSGATFVRGRQWGALEGTLAVAALKGSRVVFMRFNSRDRLVRTTTPAELRRFGRLRSVTQLPGGDLLLTTANGENDRVLRVTPRS